MDVPESLRMSARAVRGHALRSALTTLGVVIGVAAVVVFVTLGASLQADVLGEVGATEATTMYVWTGPEGSPPGAGSRPVFTEHDVAALAELRGVGAAVPWGNVGLASVTHRNDTVAFSGMTTTSPAYFAGVEFRTGGAFEADSASVVLNPAAAALFEENATAGDRLTVTLADGTAMEVTVAGVLASSGPVTAVDGFGEDPRIYGPVDPFYGTRIARPGTGERQRAYPLVLVRASDPAAVDAVRERALGYLRNRSDARDLMPANAAFLARTNEQLLAQVRELLETLTGFVTGVALISLVVGAIGIANIMLVNVTERTREVGIMKAVGARRGDVLQLFLVEAVLLGVAGAAGGLLVGVAGGYAATRWLGLPFVFPLVWSVVAVVAGLVVGAVSGLYPAWRAARTDPIEALRYE